MIPLQKLLLTAALIAVPAAVATQVVDFATLSDFKYVEGMDLPQHVKDLDGKQVSISGFMRREDGSQEDSDTFMLVNDACGCSGMPFLNEIVFCTMPSGTTTPIQPGVVTVTGTLYVGETKEGGVVVSLYTMDVDTVGS